MDKKRIFIIGKSFNKGGIDTYIDNIYPFIEKDFEIVNRAPIMEIDGKKWETPSTRHNPIKYIRFWKKFFKENKFDIIYFNTCDIVNIDPLKFAKKAGIPIRIIHSHSTARQKEFKGFKGLIHRRMEKASRKNLHKYATHLLACSKVAGDWMFDGRDYTVINNGINIEKYKYNPNKRQKVLKEYNLEDGKFIGAIGHLERVKNPFRTFEIFKEVCTIAKDVKCFFIGEGSFRKELEKKVKEYGLADRIIFTGSVNNVEEWLSVLDVLVMPSLFEGLPFVLVEAQAAGITCIVSDTVSLEANISGLIHNESLLSSNKKWAQEILKRKNFPREDVSKKLIERGYSITSTTEVLINILSRQLEIN